MEAGTETFWTPGRGTQLAEEYKYVILTLIALYFPVLRFLEWCMKDREPMDLKRVSAVWNVSLSVLSLAGAAIMLWQDPNHISRIFVPETSLSPMARMVVAVFTLTKVVEFGDTILLVLRKRPVGFLHSYHHFTVAIYCWHAQLLSVSFAYHFVLLNLCIHGIMYMYYAFAMTMRHPLLRAMRPYVTMLQTGQMFVGISISLAALTMLVEANERFNAICALCMYASYAVLFMKFFLENYVPGVRASMSLFLGVTHLFALYGLYLLVVHPRWPRLLLEILVVYQFSGLGITAGSHRLWAHRAYKAKLPLRVLLLFLNCVANQGSIYHWARDHRTHHKFSDTPNDPHNALRGFWYSHMGWLILKKPEAVKKAGSEIDCSDVWNDPVVRLQARFDPWLSSFLCFVVPGFYTSWVYGNFLLGFLTIGLLRWIVELHATWCVNSAAHFFGYRPYDPNIKPAENIFTALVATGEGWHNWHHVFPFDYAASQYGVMWQWNPCKLFLDFMVLIGQAHSCKRATSLWELVKAKRKKAALEEQENVNGKRGSTAPPQEIAKPFVKSLRDLFRDMFICSLLASGAGLIALFSFSLFITIPAYLVYCLALGTAGLGIWVVGYECTKTPLKSYPTWKHIMGFLAHTAILIPYRPRFEGNDMQPEAAPGSAAAENSKYQHYELQKAVREDRFAALKLPIFFGCFGLINFIAIFGVLGVMYGLYQFGAVWGYLSVAKMYIGPYAVFNGWLMLYGSQLRRELWKAKSASDKTQSFDSKFLWKSVAGARWMADSIIKECIHTQ